MSFKYSVILFKRKSEAAQPGLSLTEYMRRKSQAVGNQKADKEFYESMIMFSAKVLQPAFDKGDIGKLEEELCRLFRTNAFNMTKRSQAEEKRLKKFPQLRAPTKKETADEIIHRYAMKARVPNENLNRHIIYSSKNEIRPLFCYLTPHGARNSRSPLVSLLFPSMKDKIRVFEDECKKRNESKGNNRSMIVKPSELDMIIEEESKKKKNKLNQTVNDYL